MTEIITIFENQIIQELLFSTTSNSNKKKM